MMRDPTWRQNNCHTLSETDHMQEGKRERERFVSQVNYCMQYTQTFTPARTMFFAAVKRSGRKLKL